MSDYVHTLFDISDEIATITLNRPEAKNALSIEMREEIGDALRICREQAGEGVKAIIITGAGGAFPARRPRRISARREGARSDQKRGCYEPKNRVVQKVSELLG